MTVEGGRLAALAVSHFVDCRLSLKALVLVLAARQAELDALEPEHELRRLVGEAQEAIALFDRRVIADGTELRAYLLARLRDRGLVHLVRSSER